MGTKIIRFEHEGLAKWGVYNDGISLIGGNFPTLRALLEKGHEAIKQAKEEMATIKIEEVKLLSPVTEDAQIICQGANYSTHREESGLEAVKPPYNLLFTKASSSLTSSDAEIICPANVQLLDYEIELGLIMKRDIYEPQSITDDNLADYVAGFVITNDISARDVQILEMQWFKGKSYRTFCPVGPFIYLIEPDEICYIHQLELQLDVNGECRQLATSDQLLYKPAETLEEMSEIFNLRTGDLILTGTTGGVGLHLNAEIFKGLNNPSMSHDEKVKYFVQSQQERGYLQDGDHVRLTIKSIDGAIDLGVQENKIVHSAKVAY
ncbi:FAA hydrolase family protein [Lysinibacillus yapensis]|uniref:FAA hydrolase family protein n=1 Tax=Ureibacillus yapensis TaxID=2304605 RepID=A0A396SQL2_9BACL|nr:fumarylacetoacetate hydrolase family protein [Lysinibacillus yapensis]RHW38449.1 FAA hydrolase family protein [Lysinibacillus yapensis]